MTQTQTKYRNKLRPTKRATTDFKKWIGFTHKMLDLADLVAVRLSYVKKIRQISWYFTWYADQNKRHVLVFYLVTYDQTSIGARKMALESPNSISWYFT